MRTRLSPFSAPRVLVLGLTMLAGSLVDPNVAHAGPPEGSEPQPAPSPTEEPPVVTPPADQSGVTSEVTNEPPPVLPQPPAPPRTGPLRVTVEPTIDDASLIPTWIEERHPAIDDTLALPDHEQWITIEITGATYDYRVTTTAMRDGDPVGAAAEPVVCECNSEALLTMVDAEIARALVQFDSMPVEVTHPEPEPEPEPVPEPEPEPTKRLTRLGIGGIIAGSVGVGAIVAGAALVAVNEKPTDYPLAERRYWPPGYAVLSGGMAALISGTVMLALDLTRCRRHPEAKGCPSGRTEYQSASSSRQSRLSAIVSRDAAGLVLSGRF